MKRYYDYEHDRIVHEDELIKEYESMNPDDTSATTAHEYIENCQASNGGTLLIINGQDENGYLTEHDIPETGWLNRDTACILTQEQMYDIYLNMIGLPHQYDSFMDFLADVTDINGLFRRVI